MLRILKNAAKAVLATAGYEISRVDARGPHALHLPPHIARVDRIALCGTEFLFWVGDETGNEWYSIDEHATFAEHSETQRLIRKGDRVLEIGAHHGFTAMFLAKLVGEGGFVLAVEPSPFNSMMISAQIGLNRTPHVRSLRAAAADYNGSVNLSTESNGRVTDFGAISAPCFTVDELDRQYGPFNVLKVDVEGFERQVLAGAAELLKRCPTVLLELHTPYLAPFGSTENEILMMLHDYFGTFVPRGARQDIRSYPQQKVPPDDIVNLFLESRR